MILKKGFANVGKMRKKLRSYLFLVFLFISSLFYYYWLHNISFVDLPSLEKHNISNLDFHNTMQMHQQCFEADKKEYLTRYLTMLQDGYNQLRRKEIKNQLISREVDKIIAKGKLSLFRNIQNITLAKISGEIVGMFNCTEENEITFNSIMIHNVCVSKRFRGRGVGKAMLEYAINKCRSPGKDLTLTVYQEHNKTIKLYKKLGFKITPIEKNPQDSFSIFEKVLMKYD